MYFEDTNDIHAAMERETLLKTWKRKWKLEIIEQFNPEWKDLYYEYGGKDDVEY